ncbi:initiation control protein YabA [Moorella sulfitireducens]|uniref:initiation control protein YabA n=1 Tax=Neomoorella sulfitireducens TaxID=2972948 RepID=UPI0021ABC605|nr:initiation control protein YabA [Moorella sulfitireducens]
MSGNFADPRGDTLAINLAELEGRLGEVLKEVRRLRALARALEEENQRLRTIMFSGQAGEGGHQQLLRFYEEGFHVCPPHFARVRDSDGCLFCLSFLEKKGLPPHG